MSTDLQDMDGRKGQTRLKIISIVYTSLITLIAVLYLWFSKSLPFQVGIFPWVAGTSALILCLLLLATDIKRPATDQSEGKGTGSQMDIESSLDMSSWATYKKVLSNYAWIPAIYILICLFGFHIAITIFFIAYLTFKARTRWFLVLGLTAFMVLFLLYLDELLNVWWPEGLLEQWVKLPWLR